MAEVEPRKKDLKQTQFDEDLRAVMDTPHGRRILLWLMSDLSGVFASSFTGEGLTSAYGEGKRAVGIELGEHMKRVDARLYAGLFIEQVERSIAAKE